MRYGILFVLMLLTIPFVSDGQARHSRKFKKNVYQEIDFEELMKRYFAKQSVDPLEGVYAVSCVITKRNKTFLSKRERIRIIERKDNYARVALLKDWPGTSRDYIEISLSYRDAKKFPIVGQLDLLAEGKGLIYTHHEPDGTPRSFSMVNESSDLLEAEYSNTRNRKTVTYRLSYLKIYPQHSDMTVWSGQ
jgi:hypothetical protein